MTYLNLRNNQIASITPSSQIDVNFPARVPFDLFTLKLNPKITGYYGHLRNVTSPFRLMRKLITLNLSRNKIKYLYEGWGEDLLHIEHIDLSRNQFTDIKDFAVDFSNSQTIIDLQENNITGGLLNSQISTNNKKLSMSYLILDHNPIVCDCRSYSLYRKLTEERLWGDPKYVLKNTTCTAPSNFKGQRLQEIPPKQLVCDMPEQRPANCRSCIAIAATNELLLHCLNMPVTLPKLNHKNISKCFASEPTITLNLDSQPASIRGFKVHTLNLSYTGLSGIAFSPSESLKMLDVSHNNLTTVPKKFLTANITLYLSNNPLECECQFVTDIFALQNGQRFADFEQMTCGNGDRIAEINVGQLCSYSLAMIARVGLSVAGILFIVIITLAICRHSSSIKEKASKILQKRSCNDSMAFQRDSRWG